MTKAFCAFASWITVSQATVVPLGLGGMETIQISRVSHGGDFLGSISSL